MVQTLNLPNRLGGGTHEHIDLKVKMPDLPAIDWSTIGEEKPVWITDQNWGPDNNSIDIDMIIITWTSAEWAAFDHVFCNSDKPMSHSYYDDDSWRREWKLYHTNWDKIKGELPPDAPSLKDSAWGSCRIVEFPSNNKKALLFKSAMHISTDGKDIPLRNMMEQLIEDFDPALILTIGTSGGSRNQDDLGTTNITDTARFDLTGEFEPKQYPFNHKTFSNNWKPDTKLVESIKGFLMETPVTLSELELLREKHPSKLTDPATGAAYPLYRLINKEVQPGKIPPKINILSGIPVLTTNGYQVGNTSGNYNEYAAMEMDDAVIAMKSDEKNIPFGVVRNISDPVQNSDIDEKVQGNWGGIIYSEYGLYTSFNGALAAWAAAAG